jgi:hypothetical protein
MWFLPFLIFLFVAPIHAQNTTLFSQYQSDYLYQYNLYQQTYSKYTEKAQIYAKYGTITTQQDKISAAVDAINTRNLAFKSYFMALRVMLEDYKSANPEATATVQTSLSNLENWADQQPAIVLTINDNHQLQQYVNDFQNKYLEIQSVIYTALVQNEVNLRQQTLNQIQTLAENIKNDPRIKPESQQWISTLTAKSNLVSANLTKALTLTQKKQISTHFSNFYPDAQIELNSAQNYLTEITADLKLIVTKFYQP